MRRLVGLRKLEGYPDSCCNSLTVQACREKTPGPYRTKDSFKERRRSTHDPGECDSPATVDQRIEHDFASEEGLRRIGRRRSGRAERAQRIPWLVPRPVQKEPKVAKLCATVQRFAARVRLRSGWAPLLPPPVHLPVRLSQAGRGSSEATVPPQTQPRPEIRAKLSELRFGLGGLGG